MTIPLKTRLRDLRLGPGPLAAAALIDAEGLQHSSDPEILRECCAAFRAVERWADASAAMQRLAVMQPDRRRENLEQLGHLHLKAGELPQAYAALAELRLLLAAEPAAAPTRSFLADLARALLTLAPVDAAADAHYRWLVPRRPTDRKLLEGWIGLLERSGADAPAVLLAFQADQPEVVASLAVHLLRTDYPRAAATLGGHLDRWRGSAAHAGCHAVWQAFAAGRPLAALDLDALRRIAPLEHQLYHLIAAGAARRVAILGPQRPADGDLAALGLDPAAVRAMTDHLVGRVVPAREARLAACRHANPTARAIVRRLEDFVCYQDRIVAERCFAVPDPRGGGHARLIDSVAVYDRVLYTFRGPHGVFQVMASGAGSKLLAVMLPAAGLVLDLADYPQANDLQAEVARQLSPKYMAGVGALLAQRLLRHAGDFDRALTDDRPADAPRRVVVALGRAENPMHHVWNFLPGLERLVAAGTLRHVERVISAGSEFYGPLPTLFPELAGIPLERVDHDFIIDPHPFSPDHVLVQPAGHFIEDTVVARILAGTRDAPPRSGDAEPPAPGAAFPVVWFGLRVGSRSWQAQGELLPRLIDRILERHPGALFCLDGFSHPVGEDLVSARWEPIRAELAAIAARIKAGSSRPDRVVSLVGNSLANALRWACRADTYMAAVGTSQCKVGWFAPGPGVVHSEAGITALPAERRNGCWESALQERPEFTIGRVVDRGVRYRADDVRTNIGNVDLDLDEVLALLLRQIAARR